MTTSTSLRERTKARRRSAIQRAGLRLFAERGYDRATVADIAAEAEVAPRTVTLYFPTKQDIATSYSSELAARLTETVQANPDLTFIELIDRWLSGVQEATDPELAQLTAAMFAANPDLRAVSNAHVAEASTVASEAFLVQLGLGADHPMVKLAGAAVGALITEYLVSLGSEPQVARPAMIAYLTEITAAAGRSLQ